MDDSQPSTAGIEVHEQALSTWELGFLTGVFAAWGIRVASQEELRDAMKLLMAQRQYAKPSEADGPKLRLVSNCGDAGFATPGSDQESL